MQSARASIHPSFASPVTLSLLFAHGQPAPSTANVVAKMRPLHIYAIT